MKLTKERPIEKADTRLTKSTTSPFIISFKYKLKNGYTFKDLNVNDNKIFQQFLDKVSNMTIDQVDKLYRRDPDKQDILYGNQVQHYEVDITFRIHGIYENGRFKVLRLDPAHKKHK